MLLKILFRKPPLKVVSGAFCFFLFPMTKRNTKYSLQDIVAANDDLRINLTKYYSQPSSHKCVVLSARVIHRDNLADILEAVTGFRNFHSGNDPHGEHDFGIVEVARERYFFKVDYYDKTYNRFSDPYQTAPHRVLTIAHIDEY